MLEDVNLTPLLKATSEVTKQVQQIDSNGFGCVLNKRLVMF